MLDEIVKHALEDAPNECCGVVAARGEPPEAVAVHRRATSPQAPCASRSTVAKSSRSPRRSNARATSCARSTTRTRAPPPYPSQTDINFAANWPGVEWVIVGLDGGAPEVRSYLITGGEVAEVALLAAAR